MVITFNDSNYLRSDKGVFFVFTEVNIEVTMYFAEIVSSNELAEDLIDYFKNL